MTVQFKQNRVCTEHVSYCFSHCSCLMLQFPIVMWQKTGHAVRAIGRLSSMAMMAGVSAKKGSPTEGTNTNQRHGVGLPLAEEILSQCVVLRILGDSLTIHRLGTQLGHQVLITKMQFCSSIKKYHYSVEQL